MSVAFYSHPRKENTLIAIVGLGLIGQTVADQLYLQATSVPLRNSLTVDWTDPQILIECIERAMTKNSAGGLELVWCAGKAGFASKQSELKLECRFFEVIMTALSQNLRGHLVVNLLSSAGGIYEHSGYVSQLDFLTPVRPYAKTKLAQEKLLEDLQIEHRVYRVSSAYGLGGSRVGIVSAMLNSAINRQPMVIYANQHTLRDYIMNTDIAKVIVNDLLANASLGIRILASGRATSVDMLINIVHKIVGARPLHSFQPNDQNSRDIVFSPKVICCPTRVTSIEVGIRIMSTKLRLIGRGNDF